MRRSLTSRRRLTFVAAALALAALGLAATSAATLVPLAGVTKIAPPASAEEGALESNTTIFAWDEHQCVTLASDLVVDITSPGKYGGAGGMTPPGGTIPAGTIVSSHFLHGDLDESTASSVELNGTITTDADILGIIARNGAPSMPLNSSDFLGEPETMYDKTVNRTVEFGGGVDFVIEFADMRTVNVNFRLTTSVDNVRVVTRCAAVAPPAAGAFAIGDNNAVIGNSVTFWGAKWAKLNSLSGGPAPNAFKGFANMPAMPTCGVNWTTDPGNSSNPPESVPDLMAVIVTSSVVKNGKTISGNTPRIAVVDTNPGYGPAPGHTGTGTVVGFVC